MPLNLLLHPYNEITYLLNLKVMTAAYNHFIKIT